MACVRRRPLSQVGLEPRFGRVGGTSRVLIGTIGAEYVGAAWTPLMQEKLAFVRGPPFAFAACRPRARRLRAGAAAHRARLR